MPAFETLKTPLAVTATYPADVSAAARAADGSAAFAFFDRFAGARYFKQTNGVQQGAEVADTPAGVNDLGRIYFFHFRPSLISKSNLSPIQQEYVHC